MLKDLLKDVIIIVAGKQAEEISDLIHNKTHVNEFIIAKKMDITINQTRNILYKISDHGLVSSIRKKDKRKGWYTYFWKLEVVKSLEFLKNILYKRIQQIKNQIKSRETKEFYVCETCHIEFNEENALLHNFTCDECGQVFSKKDNTKMLKELRKILDKLRREMAVVNEEMEKEIAKEEKKKAKEILKNKATKKKTTKKKVAKKSVKKLVKKPAKKVVKKKIVKKKAPIKKKIVKKKAPIKKKGVKKPIKKRALVKKKVLTKKKPVKKKVSTKRKTPAKKKPAKKPAKRKIIKRIFKRKPAKKISKKLIKKKKK